MHLPDLPGYRRRIRIEPQAAAAIAMLEDDFHCMRVTLRHDGAVVTTVMAETLRTPWTTCSGAAAQLKATFEGMPLAGISARCDKKRNCTHLHDLAVLAARHAHDDRPTQYDISANDPVDGEVIQQLWRDGELVFVWHEQGGVLTQPAELAGKTLFTLRDWIGGLAPPQAEAARLLQWASIVAHGRTIPPERRLTAQQMPANCYTFQPEHAAHAQRTDTRRDFSAPNAGNPLAGVG